MNLKNLLSIRKLFGIAAMLSVCASLTFPMPLFAGSAKVIIAPVTVEAGKEMAYLKTGIADMMATRLASQGKVFVTGRAVSEKKLSSVSFTSGADRVKAIGKKRGADYLLLVRLKKLNKMFRLEGRVVPVGAGGKEEAFTVEVPGEDKIIDGVNTLSARIMERVFGIKALGDKSGTGASEGGFDSRAHPEKLIESEKLGEKKK